MNKPTPTDLRVRDHHFGPSGEGTPAITDGDSSRVLCFMNLSGAYNGYAGVDQARQDARQMAAGPKLLAFLREIRADHARMRLTPIERLDEMIATATGGEG